MNLSQKIKKVGPISDQKNLFCSLFSLDSFLCYRPFGHAFMAIIFDLNGHFTLNNYILYFSSGTYLLMTWNSILYALIITVATLVISYPVAYVLTKLKMKQFWLMLIILPTWVNLLLKAYAFIGIFGKYGSVNNFYSFWELDGHRFYLLT